MPLPSPTAASPSESPPGAYKIDVFIDQATVTPLRRAVRLERGRSVVLVTRSDHDATLTIQGPEIDERVFVARQTTISSTFVAGQPGVVTIKSVDPAATIAELTIS